MSMLEGGGGGGRGADDTHRLVARLQSARTLASHTEYIIDVQCGPSKESKWSVSRRYRDFAALHASLQPAGVPLPLPPKKLIGNMQPAFVAERQIALQNYLTEVLKHPILALSLPVRRFLDPKNYSLSIQELALQTVSIALRGDGGYELRGPVPDIGWRICKRYFLVSNEQRTKSDRLLSWQQYGPDKCLADKDMQGVLKSLQNISHPYVAPILLIHSLETGAYVVRNIHEKGTIRDLLYNTDYTKTYLSKYGNPKVRKPFTDQQLSHYGRQILQALHFLHEKGLPYGHLHPGNLAIESQKVLLLDIENGVLGAASLYRPYFLEHKAINTMEAIDVHCFGRTMYEMACAAPLEQSSCDIYPADCTENLVSVLRLCLSSTACKHGMPTVHSLLLHPFFTMTISNGLSLHSDSEPRHLKFPVQLKERLREAAATVERRLIGDQKMVRSEKREVRIQEILNSDEMLRKQKRRMKKRDSIWKSTSSLTESGNTRSVSTASSPTPPHLPDTSHNSTTSVKPSGPLNGHKACSTPASPPPPGGGRSAPASPPPVGGRSAPTSPPPPGDGRSALLSAICSFNKGKLQRVNAQ